MQMTISSLDPSGAADTVRPSADKVSPEVRTTPNIKPSTCRMRLQALRALLILSPAPDTENPFARCRHTFRRQ